MAKIPSNLRHIESLVEIVSELRGPNGCPWDKEQTHQTLTQYAIEEAHEFVEAVELPQEGPAKDAKMKDELGDVLFQVVLHAQLAQERGAFTLADVIENLTQKLVRRHPHVFGETSVKDSADVARNWEEIKKQERKEGSPYALNVPALPALQRAYKIGRRTEKLQFDWEDADGAMRKVEEEFGELQEALDNESEAEIFHELGDTLFSLAQLGRHLNMEPEQVLRKANQRFEARFNLMVEIAEREGHDFGALSMEQKDVFWEKAKIEYKNRAKS